MSMTSGGASGNAGGPEQVLNQSASETVAATPQIPRTSRLWKILFALFALELGLFLAVYPWTDFWNLNHLPAWLLSVLPGGEATHADYPDFGDVWDDPAFRSAISGLGALDIWIAFRALISVFRRR